MTGRNNVRLAIFVDGQWIVSHFSLKEFENSRGWAMVHHSVVESLEKLRSALSEMMGEEIEIIVTNATRTEEENTRLGERYGWTSEGGKVAKNSKHLEKYGGIAVDFYARKKQGKGRIPSELVGSVARRYFCFVKSDYPDGHVHADNRNLEKQ